MFDAHTHCQRHEHWGTEWRDHWQPVFGHDWVDVRPDAYDEAMAAAGVDAAFVFGIRATKVGLGMSNEFVAHFCDETETETIGFMSLDLSDDDVMVQLEDGVARGLRGIKLYPVLAGFDPRDPAHGPLLSDGLRPGPRGLVAYGSDTESGGRPVPEQSIARR